LASTPDELTVRVEALDADARDQWYQDGFEEGRRQGREEAMWHAGPGPNLHTRRKDTRSAHWFKAVA
jgi:hypothetical protein